MKEYQIDTEFLKQRTRQWLTRFLTGDSLSCSVMAEIKTCYALKYGFDELKRVWDEVTIEVAREMIDGEMLELQKRRMEVGHLLPCLRCEVASVPRTRKPRWSAERRLRQRLAST